MKIKVINHKFNIHCRGSPWRSRTQQHAYCLRYTHSQHIESHLCKKQLQPKILKAFLFSQLHFNNVALMLFFTAAILLCAVQNQRITLRCCTVQNLGPQSTLDTITKTDLYKVQSRYFEPCRDYSRLSFPGFEFLGPHINVSLRGHPVFRLYSFETRS